jgi:hypothetical protein
VFFDEIGSLNVLFVFLYMPGHHRFC